VVIGGDYDTKRMSEPFVGANEGGSSAAFLLEMARVLAHGHNNVTYWLVFFDGEEAISRWSNSDGLYGSRHFAAELQADGHQSQMRALCVVDITADAYLDIQREAHSTPRLTDIVFSQAYRLGDREYFLDGLKSLENDHISFLKLGLPAIDIITVR
jgi:Zn-dependent M28 family amino/carboxypeptidase